MTGHMRQHRAVLLVLYLALCAVFIWILIVGEGWWLAVPGMVTLGLWAVAAWLKRAGRGPFKRPPEAPPSNR
jgi:hypothetical protein